MNFNDALLYTVFLLNSEYSIKDLTNLSIYYNSSNIVQLAAKILGSSRFHAEMKGRELIEKIKDRYPDIQEIKGYFFVKEPITESVSKNLLANGDLKQLLHTRDNLHAILTKNGTDTVYTPYFLNLVRQLYKPEMYNDILAEINKSIDDLSTNQYKINLQPKEKYLEQTVEILLKMLNDKKTKMNTFKIYVDFPQSKNGLPAIVVYPFVGYTNAKTLLLEILEKTQPEWGTGIVPRGTIKVNDLVYYAGGDWDYKLLHPDLFNKEKTLYKDQLPLL